MNINQYLKANPRDCRYGAPMGHHNYSTPEDLCYLQRITLNQGYAPDGTYYGSGEPIYCALGKNTRLFVRAKTRELAKQALEDRNLTWRI